MRSLNVAIFYNISFKQIKFEYISQSRLLNSVATGNMGREKHTYARKVRFSSKIFYIRRVCSGKLFVGWGFRGARGRQNSEIGKKLHSWKAISAVHTVHVYFFPSEIFNKDFASVIF